MNLRNIDGTEFKKMSSGSHKKILFDCDGCGTIVEQSYRNYLAQNNGKFCRTCRNKHTANRPDVKEKQSKILKEKWMNHEYREKTSKSLSIACTKSWTGDLGKIRRSNLSNNNPMNDFLIRKKLSESTTETKQSICDYITSIGYEYINHKKILDKVIVEYKCNNGHIIQQRLNDLRGGHRCKECFSSSSLAEKEIAEYIKNLIPDTNIIFNDRSIIKPLELDIVIPEKHIAIEYCGLYWHSYIRGGKDRKYHLHKHILCDKQGYQLITIFEDEWLYKKEIVKNRLKHFLKKERGLYARKCTINEISSGLAKNFIELHHIQGYAQSSIRLGAFLNNILVAVMTFSTGNISKGNKSINNVWELSRFCTSCSVVGIAGKLLAYFERNYKPIEIYSYADKRWSNGNVYNKIGFTFVKNTDPNMWYIPTNEIVRLHRFNFRKDRIKHLATKEGMTEWDIMQEQGYDKIYDCGNMKFKKTFTFMN